MPTSVATRKIVIPSKKHCKRRCPEIVHRKPVKGCYCNLPVKKSKSKRLRHMHDCVQSYSELRPTNTLDDIDKQILSPPISAETVRRVQKIDYAPKSQFLRNVQSKANRMQNVQISDSLESCEESTHDHEELCPRTRQICVPDLFDNRETSDDCGYHDYRDYEESTEESRTPRGKKLKPQVFKRAINSKRSVNEPKNVTIPKSPRNKKSAQVINSGCPCCGKSLEKISTVCKKETVKPRYCEFSDAEETSRDSMSEEELRHIHQFREQNYFDTHGSSHTLLSSRSSGSLEQYLLNERFFPEPVRRVHKRDLVLTVPPCSTMQRKRIHYFPRYIVKQVKNCPSATHKKKRCQSCPLTGHAIDLGVLKARPPINSLALKYQKQIP